MKTFAIAFAPATLPAFAPEAARGHWTNYDQVDADGLRALHFLAELVINDDPNLWFLTCDVNVVLKDFPAARYNIVYGDGTFESALSAWLCERLGLDPETTGFGYSESGMQPHDGAHLEAGERTIDAILSMSAHRQIALAKDPMVLSLRVGDTVLKNDPLPDWAVGALA